MEFVIIRAYIGVLIYASIIDIRKLMVYDRVHLLIILFSILNQTFFNNIAGALILTIPFLMIAIKTNQIGGGDIKYIFTNSLFLGLQKSYGGILIGLACLLIYHYSKKIVSNEVRGKQIALIPFLSLGFIISILL